MMCAVLSGCPSKTPFVGTYEALDSEGGVTKKNVIELMENGKGVWRCCHGEVEFSWHIKGTELRINAKEGGVMVGALEKGAFTVAMPGQKTLRFARTERKE